MRAYFFGNMYLSSIQQGIQAAHCMTELFVKYLQKSPTLHDWAVNHKTMILLNGGDMKALCDIRWLLEEDENSYPWTFFEESVDALSGALTCVGIILPEKVYEGAEALRKAQLKSYWAVGLNLSSWEIKLCDLLNSCGLAR